MLQGIRSLEMPIWHLQFSPSLPYVFTEHGAIMAAWALNTKERFLRQDIYMISGISLELFLLSGQGILRLFSFKFLLNKMM
jgi:hypothetical protein